MFQIECDLEICSKQNTHRKSVKKTKMTFFSGKLKLAILLNYSKGQVTRCKMREETIDYSCAGYFLLLFYATMYPGSISSCAKFHFIFDLRQSSNTEHREVEVNESFFFVASSPKMLETRVWCRRTNIFIIIIIDRNTKNCTLL